MVYELEFLKEFCLSGKLCGISIGDDEGKHSLIGEPDDIGISGKNKIYQFGRFQISARKSKVIMLAYYGNNFEVLDNLKKELPNVKTDDNFIRFESGVQAYEDKQSEEFKIIFS